MLFTRHLNRWLGTSYSLEEVGDYMTGDPLFLDIFQALTTSVIEPKKTEG